MKLKNSIRLGLASLLSVTALSVVAVPSAFAATITWTGGAASTHGLNGCQQYCWSVGGNWSGGVAPVGGDDLVFNVTSMPALALNGGMLAVDDFTNTIFGNITVTGSGSNSKSVYLAGYSGASVTPTIKIAGNFTNNSNTAVTLSNEQYISDAIPGHPNGFYIGSDRTSLTVTNTGTPGSHTITNNSSGLGVGINVLNVGAENVTIDNESTTVTAGTNMPYQVTFGEPTGSGNLTKTGPGVATIYGFNGGVDNNGTATPFTGNLTVQTGLLNVMTGGANMLGTGTTTVSNGASLYIYSNSNAQPSGSNGTISGPLVLNGAGDGTDPKLTFDDTTNSSQYGAVTETGTLTMNQNQVIAVQDLSELDINGTVTGGTVTADPNYGGVLTVAGSQVGTSTDDSSRTISDSQPGIVLTVPDNTTISLDGTRGDTEVQSGGTLMGSGTTGDLTVDTGGTVAPGHSPGCLSTANETINGTYQVQVGGTTACTGYDQLQASGTVDVTNGTLDVELYGGFVPSVGDTYTIIANNGSSAVTGTFSGLAEGASYTNDGVTYTISYAGGDGNDVVLTVTKIDAAAVPKTPNTGLAAVVANPLFVLLVTTGAAAGLLVTARRVSFAKH